MKELLAPKGIEVQIFPASQLGNQRDIIEAMRLGSIDLNNGGTATFTTLSRELGVVDLPYIWKDFDHAKKIISGPVGDNLKKSLDPFGLRIMYFSVSFGFRNVVTVNKKVTSLRDMRNLKLRTIESPVYIGTMQALGASPTPLGFDEIYTALQTNVVDGYEHDAPTTYAYKFYEVAKYFTKTEHMLGLLCTVVSSKTWDKLNETQRKNLLEASIQADDYVWTVAPKKEGAMLDVLKKNGMEIIEVDKKPFIEAVQSFNKQYADSIGAADILKMITQ